MHNYLLLAQAIYHQRHMNRKMIEYFKCNVDFVTSQVVWFTSTFPVAVLIVLLVRALTLSGADVGILYFFFSPKSTRYWRLRSDITVSAKNTI